VGFDNGRESLKILDGETVEDIHSDLTSSVDITSANRLRENKSLGYLGVQKGGPFDIPFEQAAEWIGLPRNPNGRPNSDVIKPRLNGFDIMRRSQNNWIIDFGPDMLEAEAALFEAPFEYVQTHVKPLRATNPRRTYRDLWWLHTEPRQGLRAKLAMIDRFICTPTVAKYRVFVWGDKAIVPDHQLVVFARDDDYFFGVLHSRAHEVWSLRMGTWLGKGNDPRYTPTTCFETFPLPWPPGTEPVDDPRVIAIGEATANLDRLRRNWLDPEGASEAELKKRTLTNLYNVRPTWLQHAHAALDRAVWAAYGWDDPDPAAVDEDTILSRLLALNLERSSRASIRTRYTRRSEPGDPSRV